MNKSHILQRHRSDERPDNLVIYLVISILLHSVLLLGNDEWFRAFAPKQELSEPIPIEYVEIPPEQTKTPSETSRRAIKDSVAGGKANPRKPLSTAKSAPPTTPKASSGLRAVEALPSEQTPQKAISPNPSPQKPQPQPSEIAVAPANKLPEPQPSEIATAPTTKLPEPLPQTAVTPTTPLQPEPSTTVAPTTKPLATKLQQRTVTPTPELPEPQPSPTATAPTTKPLATKLRQRTVTPTPELPEPQPSPTAVAPTTKPLATKLRQRTVTPTPELPEPQLSPTAVAPTTKPLATKLRQRTVTPTPELPEPQPSPTATAPTPKPPNPELPTAVAPTTKPSALKPPQTTVAPTTKPPALKPQQTAVAPTTSPPSLTRQENSDRLTAKSSAEQLQTRTTSQKPSQVQPSSKTGAASRLGGPISLSNRDFGNNDLAALPNSNRLNQSVDGIDARQDADMGAYIKQLQERVRQQWIPGQTQSSRRTVLHFTISRSGQVSNLQIAQTSGFNFTDEAAVGAVKRAAPFAPLPTAYTENYINIHFTFNINVYGELEVWRGNP
jgi:TonB family protein